MSNSNDDSIINTNDIVINRTKKINTVIKTLCRILIERKYTTKSLDELVKKITPSINDDEIITANINLDLEGTDINAINNDLMKHELKNFMKDQFNS